MVSARLGFIDNAKAVGIVLVVLGHTYYASTVTPLMNLIFGFHMPLFFLISGMLAASHPVPWQTLAHKLRLRLLAPYVFFFALSYAYWLATRRFSQSGVHASDPWWQPLVFFVTGAGVFSANQPLWFFWGLASTMVMFEALRRWMSPAWIVLVALVLGLAMATWRQSSLPRLPFALDCASVALFFYAAGHAAVAYRMSLGRLSAAAVAMAFAVIYVVSSLANGRVDMQALQFGAWPILYFVNGVTGTIALLAFAATFEPLAITRWLSDSTLYIFPTHAIGLAIATGLMFFALRMPLEQIHASPLACIGAVLFAIAFAVPFTPSARRWAIAHFTARASTS